MASPKAKVALVACGSQKLSHGTQAQDLYTSTWFKLARSYARKHCSWWYILSARHGIVAPYHYLEPYNEILPRSRIARTDWALDVADIFGDWWDWVPDWTQVVMLAGDRYAHPLGEILQERGYQVEYPLAGLGIGQQQAWLKQNT